MSIRLKKMDNIYWIQFWQNTFTVRFCVYLSRCLIILPLICDFSHVQKFLVAKSNYIEQLCKNYVRIYLNCVCVYSSA
jgi:hypothetical protein